MLLKRLGLTLLFIAGLAQMAGAAPINFLFDVSIRGFRVGEIRFSGNLEPGRYEMQGFMGTRGFFGAFISTRYSGAVIGRTRGARLQPSVFRGRFEQRRQFAQVDIKFKGNSVSQVTRTPERAALPHDINPTSVSRALDPISGTFALLRDVAPAQLCSQSFDVFEGSRLSKISLFRVGETADGEVECRGAYTRLRGFSAAQLAERKAFPFRLIYAQRDDGNWWLREFVTDTPWGRAKATRRR